MCYNETPDAKPDTTLWIADGFRCATILALVFPQKTIAFGFPEHLKKGDLLRDSFRFPPFFSVENFHSAKLPVGQRWTLPRRA